MSLFDSNIIIEASRLGEAALGKLTSEDLPSTSAICYVEVLGYHRLTEGSRASLETFFSAIRVLPLSGEVINRAVRLRQIRKMGLGDALVAGTALVHGLALVTRNVKDFDWVDGLTLVDPGEAP